MVSILSFTVCEMEYGKYLIYVTSQFKLHTVTVYVIIRYGKVGQLPIVYDTSHSKIEYGYTSYFIVYCMGKQIEATAHLIIHFM